MLLTIHLRGEMSAGDVAARFSHAWPTTTRHLRVLEHAGLVRFERQGRKRVYRVEHARLGLVAEWLSWFDRPAAASAPCGAPGEDEGGATDGRLDPLTEMRRICLALPETAETMTWGQPHFRVRGKIFAGFGDHGGTFTLGFKLEREHADAAIQDPRFARAPYVGHTAGSAWT